METKAAEVRAGVTTERRIAWLTILLGLAAALAAALLRRWTWAGGLTVGTALAWLNFRWLRRGLDGLVTASIAQSSAEKPRVPTLTYALMILRYGLIALAVYVIFEVLKVPLLSMVLGLCALGAATIAASVYEILRPVE
jgi:small-conductance mechanosensitive channel